MAVVVNISDTEHLTFSPLNEKHNILYYRARNNVNVRHIQRPWFDLNPFLDKEDDKWKDLNKYQPEHDHGITPLESLTIVEDFFSDKPLLTKEFKIGEFWDFLFSEDWSSGYSVRVLEGRLQNLLVTCLVSMIQTKTSVQHSTAAFAKNRRQRYSVYKHSEKEPELGDHEETLLVEFIYYGHSVRQTAKGPSLRRIPYNTSSSDGYPRDTTTTSAMAATSSGFSTVSTEVESDTEPNTIPDQGCNSETTISTIPPCPPSTDPPGRRQRLLKKRVRISRETITSEATSDGQQLINRTISRIKEQDGHPSSAYGILRKDHLSDISSGSSDCRFSHTPLDLNKFMCTEKVSYLGEFDLSDDSSVSSSDSDDDDFGQEYYLGDQIVTKRTERCETVEEKLKRRKEIVRQARVNRRAERVAIHEVDSPILPEFSELDLRKYLTEAELKNEADPEHEKVPDLVEYIKILKADERRDQTVAYKIKQMKNKLMKRYNMVKPGNEKFADCVGGVTDSQACRMHCYNMDPSWKAMSSKIRRKFLVEKLIAAGGKVNDQGSKKIRRVRRQKRKLEVPFIYITAPSGHTHMHPVSKLMLQKRIQEQQEKARQEASPNKGPRRVSLLPSGYTTALAQEKSKKRWSSLAGTNATAAATASTPIQETTVTSPERENISERFPKAKQFTGMESPDLCSDDESDGLEEGDFRANKLNIRYSIERIRRTRAKKKKENSLKQTTFFEVLRKYYRMQSILRAFGQKTTSSISAKGNTAFGMKLRMKNKAKQGKSLKNSQAEQEPITIGKLKWFPFLDVKRESCSSRNDFEEALFENFPMDKFRMNLEAALDQFVVRREVVISDYNAKASVSITFTKKSVFTKSRNLQ